MLFVAMLSGLSECVVLVNYCVSFLSKLFEVASAPNPAKQRRHPFRKQLTVHARASPATFTALTHPGVRRSTIFLRSMEKALISGLVTFSPEFIRLHSYPVVNSGKQDPPAQNF